MDAQHSESVQPLTGDVLSKFLASVQHVPYRVLSLRLVGTTPLLQNVMT